MTYPTLTDVETTIDKLRNLEQYLPGKSQIIYTFGKLFADELRGHSGPIDATNIALIGAKASEPLERRKQDSMNQLRVSMQTLGNLSDIVKATFPKEFADSLEDYGAKVDSGEEN